MTDHHFEADGYCTTHKRTDCTPGRPTPGAGQPQRTDFAAQLNRIEQLLRQVARRVGVDIEGDET